MTSLVPGYRALVFGGTGGIGGAVCTLLQDDPACAAVYSGARTPQPTHEKVTPFHCDITDDASIAAGVALAARDGPLDLVFVATGVLHAQNLAPEKTWRAQSAAAYTHAFSVNAIGPALIAKHALACLRRPDKAVFAAVSARVGSISDNALGGWHAYRASKAALNMIMRTCAIELAHRAPNAVCVTLHPGTVDTGLSKPFQSAAKASTLKTPHESARAMLNVLNRATSDQSGLLLDYAGSVIPF
jgi:NAD(P)-dependent dehydrogenase (short-subunit alcohol dehydrogenase family)